MTLLREIQTLLERTYAPVAINLESCVIGEARCAVLNRLVGESAAHLAPGGRTFLRQADDSLYVAIFYSRPIIAELEENDPRQALNERNISALITFIEEIAHGVQAALLFLEGEREIESESYARNLEAQARVDTYLVLSRFVHLLCGKGKFLHRWAGGCGGRFLIPVIANFRRRCCGSVMRRRKNARWRFCGGCGRVPLEERCETLRQFRALNWPAKLSLLGWGSCARTIS